AGGAAALGLPVATQRRKEVVPGGGRLVEALVASVAVDIDARALDKDRGTDALCLQPVNERASGGDATVSEHCLAAGGPAARATVRSTGVDDAVDAGQRAITQPSLVGIPDGVRVALRAALHLDDLVPRASQVRDERRADE